MAVQNAMFDQPATMFFDYFNNLNATFANTLNKNRALMTKGMDLLREEGFALADRRLDRNRDLVERWHECREMSDLLAIQQEWLNDLARDYFDGTLRASTAMQEAMVARMAPTNGHDTSAKPATAAKKEPEKPVQKAA